MYHSFKFALLLIYIFATTSSYKASYTSSFAAQSYLRDALRGGEGGGGYEGRGGYEDKGGYEDRGGYQGRGGYMEPGGEEGAEIANKGEEVQGAEPREGPIEGEGGREEGEEGLMSKSASELTKPAANRLILTY